jgi:flagellar motor switch protein FliM
MIDSMLGGRGQQLDSLREFTEIELSLLRDLSRRILADLQEAWDSTVKVRASLREIFGNPRFADTFEPEENVFVTALSLRGDRFQGELYMCNSCFGLEAMERKLTSPDHLRAHEELVRAGNQRTLVEEAAVTIAAELGSTETYTLRDLASLKLGDVIRLATRPGDPVTVKVDGAPTYKGMPGTHGGKLAVRIQD